MNTVKTQEEVQELIVGTWHGSWVGGAGGVSESYYTFSQDGRWSHGDSTSNTVRNAGIASGYSSSSESGGTYFINEAGNLILQYQTGQEWKPSFEVSKSGNDIRIGNVWFGKC